jgi:hypothetical protein
VTRPATKKKAAAKRAPKKKKTPKPAARKAAPTKVKARRTAARPAGKAAPKPAARTEPWSKGRENLPQIGAPIRGGFFAGKFFGADGKAYGLIVAPKAGGETEAIFKTERTTDTGARSLRDGFANSQAMNDAAHPAAKFCRDLRIGGFTDWYLPSRHEAALLAETLMPGADYVPEQTVAAAFREGGPEAFSRTWYWTSTEWSAGYAWSQYFYYGGQYGNDEDWSCRVRAVRKYPL